MKKGTRTGQAGQRTRAAAKVGRRSARLTARPAAATGAGVAEDIERDLQRGGATVGRLFAQLTARPAAALGAGVAEDIERDLQRGGAAVGRRIGTAFLSRPFGESAARLRSNDGAAVAMAEALATIRDSAKAHRDVAALLDMAEARLVLALGQVVRDIEARKPGGRRAAA